MEHKEKRKEKTILFITGAGLSVESGLPTYWGKGGVYENISREAVADIICEKYLIDYPRDFWTHLEKLYGGDYKPNEGHKIIHKMCKNNPKHLIVTQNVDNLHIEGEGINIVELHGNNKYVYCMKCRKEYDVTGELIKECVDCKVALRPKIILFGDNLKYPNVKKIHNFMRNERVDYIVTVGTQSQFGYILDYIHKCKTHGAIHVDINTGPTSYRPDIFFQDTATEGLKEFLYYLSVNN